jgi:glycosyltransferase involved in cell wall biosynthesis
VLALANPPFGVEVTGQVPEVRPYLWNAAVGVAPLLTARGVQNKVLEAVAAGLPVVVTPLVHEGLPDQVKSSVEAAGDPAGFAAAIVRLLQRTPAERLAIAARADLESLSWARRLSPLRGLLEAACSN